MNLAFHRALKRHILTAFTCSETSPDQVAAKVCKAMIRPCGAQSAQEIGEWIKARQIRRLVHFTALKNVPNILKHGLIPRQYLELEVVRLSLGSAFSDDQRHDGMPEFSCLSITSPNYRMLYHKRQTKPGGWAVITFDSEALTRRYFEFTPTNAAAPGVAAQPGANGAEALFQLKDLRRQLDLLPCETTDPQAETLCDSILTPEFVMEVYVQSDQEKRWLEARGISAHCDQAWFMPRRDWRFWQKNTRITYLPEFGRQAS